ncbi:MAG: hypothetical protein D6732_11965 [Methanobacteriota archaeon]|nr:MAG: hypothetical protein D6732_11965 [Euryarchaeota archaeon]
MKGKFALFNYLQIFSWTGIFILLTGSIIAVIVTPSFDLMNSYLSSLGNRRNVTTIISGSRIQASPYPEVFNITLLLCSIFLMAPIALQTILFNNRVKGAAFIFLHGTWFAWLLAMIAMAAVAIADTGTDNFHHGIALTEFFGLATLSILYRLVMIFTSGFASQFSLVDRVNSVFLVVLGLTRAIYQELWTEIVGDFIFQRIFVIGFLIFLIELIRANKRFLEQNFGTMTEM